MSAPFSRKHLSAEGLLREARRVFAQVPDAPDHDIPLVDYLMSGLALFGLKYPSLLQFEHDRQEETMRANLRALYGIERVPCDTRFRERLDEVAPSDLCPLYQALFSQLQRGKGLEGFEYLDGHYLLSLDGTGYFSSQKVHGAQCAEKHHRDGTTTYYHQMLGRCWCIRITGRSFRWRPNRSSSLTGRRKTIVSATRPSACSASCAACIRT